MAKVWVVLQLREGGQIPRISLEALAAGQRVAEALGGAGSDTKAEAVLLGAGLGPVAETVAKNDLGAVHVAEHDNLKSYTPGAYLAALIPAIQAAKPDYVIFPHTYQSVDYVPRLAQAVDAALITDATGFESADGGLVWKRPVLGGKLQARVRAKGDGPVFVSVQAGAFQADSVVKGDVGIKPLEADLSGVKPDREVLGYEEVGGDQVDLTKADIIVAVGRGVGGADKMGVIEELARSLGADIGASRPVIDNGWLPRDRQIGSSGQTVAPKLYIAAGISGAIQHLVGMKASTTIVAINKDPGAPIFNVAHYGIVGDLHEVLPALTEAVKAAKG